MTTNPPPNPPPGPSPESEDADDPLTPDRIHAVTRQLSDRLGLNPTGGPTPTPTDLTEILRAIHGLDTPPDLPRWSPLDGMRRRLNRATGIDPGALDLLRSECNAVELEHVRADNLIGPRLVLDVVSHQAETLGAVARQAHGAERAQAVRLASRYEEFRGWLNQDAGRLDQAMIHTDRARDLATELRDPPLATYLLMRKSNIATDSGDPVPALAMFALAPPQWPDGLRRDHGLHLARRATAHAGVGDVAVACDLAEQSLRTVRQTGSARAIRELRRLTHQLSSWQSRSDVKAVAAAVASLVGSGT